MLVFDFRSKVLVVGVTRTQQMNFVHSLIDGSPNAVDQAIAAERDFIELRGQQIAGVYIVTKE